MGDAGVVRGLAEFALRVNDLDTMQRFYQDVVGLELIERFERAAFFKVADGHRGHTQIVALFDRSESAGGIDVNRMTPHGVSQERSTVDHFAFAVDLELLDGERARLESLELEVWTSEHSWVHWRSVYFKDPEGNAIEFVAYDGSV